MLRRFVYLCSTVLFCGSLSAQQIAVRALDAETGKPIAEYTLVWLYDSTGKQILVNHTAEEFSHPAPPSEIFDMHGAFKIGIAANGYVDCRKVKQPMKPDYLVKEVLTVGIVTPNKCTKRTTPPVLGILVLYARDPNWFERHFSE